MQTVVSKNDFGIIERRSKTVDTQMISPLKLHLGDKVNKMKYELQYGRLSKIYQATHFSPKNVHCASMKSSYYSITVRHINIEIHELKNLRFFLSTSGI